MPEKNLLVIKPEGWVDYLLIESRFGCCGKACRGVSICVSKTKKWDAGGVLKNSDVKKIMLYLRRHLYTVNKPKKVKCLCRS